jgi:hypothetical protein
MPLHEMSAQAVGGGESPLEVDGAVAFKRAEIRSGHCFLHEIECDLFTPMRGHGKTATVHGNAVPGVNAPGDTRCCELQLRSPVGCTNPEHAPNFLDQSGKHQSVTVRRHIPARK